MNPSRFIQNKSGLIAGVIIIIGVALGISSVWNDAPIVDEIPHIGSGFSYVTKGDMRLNPEHPPLAKDLAGLGARLATTDLESPFATRFWQSDLNGQWEFGRHYIFSSGNDTDKIIKFAKMPMFLFFIFSAVIIFVWSRELYGPAAGLTALFLFVFSPTVMAHSRFVTTDVPALFGVLISSFFFVKFLKNPSRKNIFIAGLALGIAQLTKFSLFLINPLFILMAFIYGCLFAKENKFKSGLYHLLMSVVVMIIGYLLVWAWYIPHTINYPAELQASQSRELLSSYGNRTYAETVLYFTDKPVFRAIAQYGLGLLLVVQRAVGGNTSYFLGEVSREAWKSYFPIVYFIKEPLPFWALLVLVLLTLSVKIKNPRPRGSAIADWLKKYFTEFLMLSWLALYWYSSIKANLNIGVRHLMPTYGFVYILVASQIIAIGKNLKVKQFLTAYTVIIASLLGWYLYENLSIYPYYLTYFNQIAGGPANGFLYVVDSNIDWGQDIKRLADWVKDNNVSKIYLDYFGWSDQSYYLKDNFIWLNSTQFQSRQDFLKENPQGGYLAVSASFYMGLSQDPDKNYNWLSLDERITTIGNSIFVWHVVP